MKYVSSCVILLQDAMVMDQPSGSMNAHKGGEARHRDALHTTQLMDNQSGELPTHLQARSELRGTCIIAFWDWTFCF